MPDQPDDTQKQQRRSTALPPFFAPRTTRPTTPVQSGTTAPTRRSSHLFTPPGVIKQSHPATPVAAPVAPRRVTPFSAPVVAPRTPASFEPPVPVAPPVADTIEREAPAPEPARAAEAEPPNAETRADAPESSESFVIEQFEHVPISLRPTGDHDVVQDEGTLSFQPYDDASGLLERDASPAPPDDAGTIEIERAEVTFEPPAEAARLEVESFWPAAAEPAAEPAPEAAPVSPLGEEQESEPAPTERDTQPMLDAIAPAAAAPDDAEEALAEAFAEPAPNESVPRWATPRVNRAVDDDRPTQPNDGWNFVPPKAPDELSAALAWPDSGLRAPTPVSVPASGSTTDTSHEMAASAEGWPLSVGGRPGVPDAVAAALERIAQRVRAGEVPLPADVHVAKSDESALALTLSALLRAGGVPRA